MIKDEPFSVCLHFLFHSSLTLHYWTDESNGWGYPTLGGPLMVMDITIRRWSKCLQVILCYYSPSECRFLCLEFMDNWVIFLNLIHSYSLIWTFKLLDSWCDAPTLELYWSTIIINLNLQTFELFSCTHVLKLYWPAITSIHLKVISSWKTLFECNDLKRTWKMSVTYGSLGEYSILGGWLAMLIEYEGVLDKMKRTWLSNCFLVISIISFSVKNTLDFELNFVCLLSGLMVILKWFVLVHI